MFVGYDLTILPNWIDQDHYTKDVNPFKTQNNIHATKVYYVPSREKSAHSLERLTGERFTGKQ
jgi:hypothetical protein